MGIIGNVSILKKHIEDQGAQVILDKKTVGEECDFLEYDLIFMGAGTERSLDFVLHDLKSKKEMFLEALQKEKVILFTGNSFEMLGKSIDSQEGLRYF